MLTHSMQHIQCKGQIYGLVDLTLSIQLDVTPFNAKVRLGCWVQINLLTHSGVLFEFFAISNSAWSEKSITKLQLFAFAFTCQT